MQKRWRILQSTSTAESTTENSADLHPASAFLLANRGITDPSDIEAFLNPVWETGVHDPFLFSNMQTAVDRVFAAFEAKERMTVHGDYDADGVTGSTLVISALRELARHVGADQALIDVYIPHRDREGYGLRLETVELLSNAQTKLIITVDCGIACVAEIAAAKARGIDTIVLDHHQFSETLPDGILIHPRLPGERYPFEHLAAVGVSWKFATALLAEGRRRGFDIPPGWEKWWLDLVSIATVTDMVPLVGENRVLLHYGLTVLNKTRRPGLRSLIERAGKQLGEMDAETIGFSIGPRINAAGRMDHALLALRLLLAENQEEVTMLAEQVERCNRERQKAVERMMVEADELFLTQKDNAALAFWNPEWSPSLVGLVAGRYAERTGKPCIAIGKHGGTWIGSGRSPKVYDITQAMQRIGEGILTRVGGHLQACGFAFVDDENAPRLAELLHQDAAAKLSPEELVPDISIDMKLRLRDIDWKLVETVNRFAPYGVGNPRPTFLSHNLEVVRVDALGKQGRHIRCMLRSTEEHLTQTFIAFEFSKRLDELQVGNRVDIVYEVGINEWNGRRDIQCRVIDVHPAEKVL